LHIALCRAQLGHAVQAKNYYEAATEKIAELENATADLLQIADQAKQLVDKLPMPESYYKIDRVFVAPDAHGLAAARQIRIGPDGNVYIASHDTDVVKVFHPDTGELLRDIGTSGGALDGPWGLLFGPDGRLYVGGRWSCNVVRFDVTTGDYAVLVPSKSGGLGAPRGLAIGPDGDLYISSHVERAPYSTDTVKKYDGVTGAYLGDFVGVGSGGLNNAAGLAFGPDGHLYVCSPLSGAINIYHGTTGKFLKTFIAGYVPGLNGPSLIEFQEHGPVYVLFGKSREIMRFDVTTGKLVELIVPTGKDESELVGMSGFALDDKGFLYVSAGTDANKRGSRVLRYKWTRVAQ
jgi:DNA-binding beta-propeller fold protein YncE